MKSLKIIICIPVILLNIDINAQVLDYAKLVGGPNGQRGFDMVVDSDKNVIVVGETAGPMDADPSSNEFYIAINSSTSWPDAFVAKYDSVGNLLWANSSGGTYEDFARSVTTDSQGNIIVSGFFRGSVDIDPGPTETFVFGDTDYYPFLQKFDPNGNLLWYKYFDMDSDQWGTDLTVDSNNNIIWGVHGSASSYYVDIGGTDSLITPSGNHFFIYKIAPNGNGIWGIPFPDFQVNTRIWEVKTDISNNIIIGGQFSGINVDIDPNPSNQNYMTSIGDSDPFCLKLDSDGNFLWAKNITDIIPNSSDSNKPVYDVECDQQGNIYCLTTISEYPDYNQSIIKLDSSGLLLWNKMNEDPIISSLGAGFAIDTGGNLYIQYEFLDSADVDPGPGIIMEYAYGTCGTNQNTKGSVLQKINTSGDLVWAKPLKLCGGKVFEIICDTDGTIMSNGAFYSGLDLTYFGGGELTSGGSRDILLSRIEQDFCSDLALSFNNFPSLNCTDSTLVNIDVSGGSTPYQISFDSQPYDSDTSYYVSNAGIYPIDVIDAMGCTRSTNLVIPGATVSSGFDLDGHLITSQFRPGFETNTTLDVFSDGCDTVSGSVKLILDSKVSLISSNPTPNNINGDTLIWDFPATNYDSVHFTPQLVLETSTSAVIGDTVCFDLFVNPISGDTDTLNNRKSYCFPVVNGYDPNDKKVYPIGKCDLGYVENNQLLTYTIRFQNTGNSQAINIVVLDSVLTNNIDLNTLRVLTSSDSMYTEILNNGNINFVFNDINLPDSSSSLQESQGYVIFEGLPLQGLSHNDEILNSAGIYFDFNPVINTNIVMNSIFIGDIEELDCEYAGIIEKDKFPMKIYPNPSNNQITISFPEVFSNIRIIITDLNGKEVINKKYQNVNQLLTELPEEQGIYLVRAEIDEEISMVKRVVKL